MKKLILAANWKMNKTATDAAAFVSSFEEFAAKSKHTIVICPSFTSIFALVNAKAKNIHVGAQNIFFESKGTYTGEISSSMLADAGVEYVIVGHSERRAMFGDTNEVVAKKLKVAIEGGFKAILCIGETYDEKLNKQTKKVLKTQLESAIKGVSATENLTVAYEPVWAISSGDPTKPKMTPTNDEIAKTHLFIKGILEKYGFNKTKILYGGSANDKNCEEFAKIENVDGFLIGGASLEVEKFASMLKAVEKI